MRIDTPRRLPVTQASHAPAATMLGAAPGRKAAAASFVVPAQKAAASLMAALVLATSPMSPALAAPPPSPAELLRLSEGLARVDYLVENWDRLTTKCQAVGSGGELEDKQVMRTQNQDKCSKTPLAVQRYIGASSTLDPLFKADKLMIRATPLVDDDEQEKYTTAVDDYIAKQQIASTMAYTSSWSGIENPNGSVEQIEDNLMEAKKEVLATRAAIEQVVTLLKLPRAPKWEPGAGV